MRAPASVSRAGEPVGKATRKVCQPSADATATTPAAGSALRQAASRAASSARVTTVTVTSGSSSRRRSSVRPCATSRPRLMITTLSQTCSTSCRMWLEMSTAIFPRSERMSSRMPRIWCGSRPMVGSSRMTTRGSARSASAMPTRWRKPFESWPMSRPDARRVRSQSSITRRTRSATRSGATSLRRARSVRYSSTRRSSGSGLFSGM